MCVYLWTVCLRVCVRNESSVTAVGFYVPDTWHRPVPKIKPDNEKNTLLRMHRCKHFTASSPVNMDFWETWESLKDTELGFFVLNWVVKTKHGHTSRHVTTWQTCTAEETCKGHRMDHFMLNSCTHTLKQHGKHDTENEHRLAADLSCTQLCPQLSAQLKLYF